MRTFLKLFLLLVFILHQQASAQINYTEKFRKELAAHPAEDTFRINRLNELTLSNDLRPGERKKFSTEALDISVKIGYESGKAMALSTLGVLQQRQGNISQGEKTMNEAEALANKTRDPELRSFIFFRKGQFLNSSKSIPYYLEAEKVTSQIGNQRLLSMIESNIGDYYCRYVLFLGRLVYAGA